MERIVNLGSGQKVRVEDRYIRYFGSQTVLASKDEKIITLYFEENVPMVDREKIDFLWRLNSKSAVMGKRFTHIENIFSDPTIEPRVWIGAKVEIS